MVNCLVFLRPSLSLSALALSGRFRLIRGVVVLARTPVHEPHRSVVADGHDVKIDKVAKRPVKELEVAVSHLSCEAKSAHRWDRAALFLLRGETEEADEHPPLVVGQDAELRVGTYFAV